MFDATTGEGGVGRLPQHPPSVPLSNSAWAARNHLSTASLFSLNTILNGGTSPARQGGDLPN